MATTSCRRPRAWMRRSTSGFCCAAPLTYAARLRLHPAFAMQDSSPLLLCRLTHRYSTLSSVQSTSTIEAAFTAKRACTALQDDQWNTEAARLTMSWSRSVDPSGKQQPHFNLTRTLRASLEACMTP